MKKKNRGVQIMAFLALFGIIIGVIGTGVLVLLSGNNTEISSDKISPEQYAQIQKLIETNFGTINNQTGITTLTGETK